MNLIHVQSLVQNIKELYTFGLLLILEKMVGGGMPLCIECGSRDNPCRCKIVGPTLGFIAFLVAAVVEWPVGAVVWCFRHAKGRKIMGQPVTHVYPCVSNAIPF